LIPSLALGLFAGVRSSEITELKWSDLTLDGPTPQVCISGQIAKKRKLRFTPLCPTALAWLKPGGTGLVAPLKFYRKLKRLSKLAEVPWRGNGMRHGFASHYYALTGDAIKVSAGLGHRSGDTILFDHYRQLVSQKEAAAYFAILPSK
jgi:integrase